MDEQYNSVTEKVEVSKDVFKEYVLRKDIGKFEEMVVRATDEQVELMSEILISEFEDTVQHIVEDVRTKTGNISPVPVENKPKTYADAGMLAVKLEILGRAHSQFDLMDFVPDGVDG